MTPTTTPTPDGGSNDASDQKAIADVKAASCRLPPKAREMAEVSAASDNSRREIDRVHALIWWHADRGLREIHIPLSPEVAGGLRSNGFDVFGDDASVAEDGRLPCKVVIPVRASLLALIGGDPPEGTGGMPAAAVPMTSDQVKAAFSPHMRAVWDAAEACLGDPSGYNLEAFRALCRPAEIMVLMREYAESPEPPPQGLLGRVTRLPRIAMNTKLPLGFSALARLGESNFIGIQHRCGLGLAISLDEEGWTDGRGGPPLPLFHKSRKFYSLGAGKVRLFLYRRPKDKPGLAFTLWALPYARDKGPLDRPFSVFIEGDYLKSFYLSHMASRLPWGKKGGFLGPFKPVRYSLVRFWPVRCGKTRDYQAQSKTDLAVRDFGKPLAELHPAHPLRRRPLAGARFRSRVVKDGGIEVPLADRGAAWQWYDWSKWRTVGPSWRIADRCYNDLGPGWTDGAEWEFPAEGGEK